MEILDKLTLTHKFSHFGKTYLTFVSDTYSYLCAQLRGNPTKERYRAATIFVDHYSRLSYVHLQKSTSAEETLEAKTAFENYARTHGVNVKL